VFEEYLNKLCNIEANTVAQDQLGEKIPTWVAIATGIPCRIQSASSGLKNLPKNIYDIATHVIFIAPPVTPAQITTDNHRVVIGSNIYTILFAKYVEDGAGVHHIELITEIIS
jgi:hypothetical protein